MGTKFGGSYSGVKGSRREHLMFVAAAGLAFSLLVILLVVFNMKQKDAPPTSSDYSAVPQMDVGTVTLYTSDSYIRAGSPLGEFQFREVYWPRSSVPEGAVLDLREFQGQFARTDIPTGTPIQRIHLTNQKVTTQSLDVTPGMRAVTIQVDAESGIEGFVRPGTRVDVVLTYMVDSNLTSKVIVQNVRVLSAGGESRVDSETVGEGRGRGKARSVPTVTLEASPADALKIQTSKQLGSLSLMMRAPEDEKAASVVEVGRAQIDGGLKRGSQRQNCNRGVMRIEGKEYMIDCDGSITEMTDYLEP